MYSIPSGARKVFQNGILSNPLITPNLPAGFEEYGKKIQFQGENAPSMPINWRFAESISAIKALEATCLLALLEKKYDCKPKEIIINTDHAQLFIMSTLLWEIDPDDKKVTPLSSIIDASKASLLATWFPSFDYHRLQATHHRASATNIYKTKDGRFFHLHGSMNPDPTLDSLGLPHEIDQPSIEESWKPFMEKISQITAEELQVLATEKYKQAGTICYTTQEYANSAHGKANSKTGLFELHHHPNPSQPPSWWPSSTSPQTSPKRPLAGLKVVDLTRVIAAPAISRGLAELGASIMRITSPHIQDYSTLHCDLNWGKWNCFLDFRKEGELEMARELVRGADVVVVEYRPAVLDKFGFGEEGIRELCEGRGRGVVVVRENCYGWRGEWMGRSGWQQISDANCGVSMEFGRAMGNNEPVTPILPNSDYCTGVAGISGILQALIQRAEKGGSWTVDVALNYYSQWLVNSVGTYPDEVWRDVWTRNGSPVYRHFHNMNYMLPRFYKDLMASGAAKVLFQDDFFEVRESKAIGVKIKCVKPVLRFPGEEVELKYNVGTRSNGVDKAVWPGDLMTEIIS